MNLPKEPVSVRLEPKTIELGRNLAKLKFGSEDKLGLLVEEAIQNYSYGYRDRSNDPNSIINHLSFLTEIGTQVLKDLCFLECIIKDIYLFLLKNEERYATIHELFAPQISQNKLELLRDKMAQVDNYRRGNEFMK